ncbi:xanthine dehydrogenase family protein molybdopterin-binding subunit, partial [Candidatus Sumerlaeota bacterium]|nr:xanthine dehydrogenase family protein molybdopterin-binding subunit [Candidatus Sumerlaeota bacterium]
MATTDARNRVAWENDGSRVDAKAKVTGAAKYTLDVNLPNMIHARFIRAPYANSKLVKYDLDAAKGVKGVLDADIDMTDRGVYAGQSVGYICAETPQAITDAMSALKLEWEAGEPIANLRKAAGPLPDAQAADQQKLDEIYKSAKHVVEATYETQVQHHAPLEVHCAVVEMLPDNRARVYGSTQGVFAFRDGLDKELGIPKESIEVIADYVGGGFGCKLSLGIEGKLAAQMAKKFSRPCKVVNSRKDQSRDTGMRPSSLQYYKLAADEQGKILGGRFQSWGGGGVVGGSGGVKVPTYNMGYLVDFKKGQTDVALSSCPAKPQRAPGYPQGTFALESALDELALAAGIEPIAFRKLNDPKTTRHKQYDIAMKEIGWERRKADGTWPGRFKRGFGCGAAEWENKMFFPAGAEVRIYRDGHVDIRSGSQDIGTGTRTMLVDITAHTLGLDRKFITGLCGSTNYPVGPFSGGSVSARSVAPAVIQACEQARGEILGLAAKELGVGPETLAIKSDTIISADGSKKMAWLDACKLIGQDYIAAVLTRSDPKYRGEGDSDGACLAEVEVDTETGVVKLIKIVTMQQCGVPVNR